MSCQSCSVFQLVPRAVLGFLPHFDHFVCHMVIQDEMANALYCDLSRSVFNICCFDFEQLIILICRPSTQLAICPKHNLINTFVSFLVRQKTSQPAVKGTEITIFRFFFFIFLPVYFYLCMLMFACCLSPIAVKPHDR